MRMRNFAAFFIVLGIVTFTQPATAQTPQLTPVTACTWDWEFVGPVQVLRWARVQGIAARHGLEIKLFPGQRGEMFLSRIDKKECDVVFPQNVLWERPNLTLTRFTSRGSIYVLVGREIPTKENLPGKTFAVGGCDGTDITATAVLVSWLSAEFGINSVDCFHPKKAGDESARIRLHQLNNSVNRVEAVFKGEADFGLTTPPAPTKADENAKARGMPPLVRIGTRTVPFPSNALLFPPHVDRRTMAAFTKMYDEAAADIVKEENKEAVLEKLREWYKILLFKDLDKAVAEVYAEGTEFAWVPLPPELTEEMLRKMIVQFAASIARFRAENLGEKYAVIKIDAGKMVVVNP